jgi:hypothetical protein
MDPAAVAWQGLVDNENDNSLVTRFTVALDEVKQEAGVQELVLTHHSGKADEERSRGASRLEDWADALWYLTRDTDGQREMWAIGRDVNVERHALAWDENRHMLVAGESYSESAEHERVKTDKELKEAVYEIVARYGEIVQVQLSQELKAAGHGVSNEKLRRKMDQYCSVPAKPGIGLRTDGQRRIYYWRDKK